MSRAFLMTTWQLKRLMWDLRGITVNVSWAQRYAEKGVDIVPGLADKVDRGVIKGNPYLTLKNNNPLHATVVLTNRNNHVVSAHVYPDGLIKFLKDYEGLKLDWDPQAPEGDSPSK
ncbi:hypothetical protein MW887_009912 [Aspergillus wentii]|nr:hypothetical protein MW887_009912 [Aspergillus wentii]